MKRIITLILTGNLIFSLISFSSYAVEDNTPFDLKAKSAVLMDADSGEIIYAKNAEKALPPASVTKIMTLLLVMEAIDRGELKLNDMISVSENAASMGGSQVFLEPGEEMSVDELLKCVVVSSANDAAVALAERVAGSEASFVARMNERADELGMKNTHFENTTGLDDKVANHTISAQDIAIASRELITKHTKIFDYTTIWMDSIRGGEFGLSNTNRLIRFYKGATGLKTGSTSKAGFCISATAKRDGMHLIAVIMGSSTRDERNAAAATLLDWGFATYSTYKAEGGSAGEIKLTGGEVETIKTEYPEFSKLLGRGKEKKISKEINLPDAVAAPIKKGDKIGSVKYLCDGQLIGEIDIIASEDADKISYWGVLCRFWQNYCIF